MNGITDRDEMLECLWQLKERDTSTASALQTELGERYREEDLSRLLSDGLAVQDGERIELSDSGVRHAQRLIRAHRIGERLIHDVMGREFESGACEFEHILTTEIVDGICTLLGHPRECPHGFPIPEGECCKISARYVQQIIVPLTELKIGQTARVAYVYTRNDQQMHRLNSLQIRPGTSVRLHQEYPSYVIECDGASIAMDAEVARNINVWIEGAAVVANPETPGGTAGAARPTFTRPRWRWRIGGRGPV
jgi:DtxR family transcriptional regulator, Mn-dependent transcriptional regulator